MVFVSKGLLLSEWWHSMLDEIGRNGVSLQPDWGGGAVFDMM